MKVKVFFLLFISASIMQGQTSFVIGHSIAYGSFRDMGTAPISFKGLLLKPSAAIEFGGTGRWYSTVESTLSVGIFGMSEKWGFDSYDISECIRVKTTIKLDSSFTSSIAIVDFLNVTINPSYENSAAGISNFLGPELFFGVVKPLSHCFSSKWFANKSIYAEIGTMPLAFILRPGYSYIDNYTSEQPVLKALFDDYQWNAKVFAAFHSDIGFKITTNTDCIIILSYLWDYYSSGKSGFWRFDYASHAFSIRIQFPTSKPKKTCHI